MNKVDMNNDYEALFVKEYSKTMKKNWKLCVKAKITFLDTELDDLRFEIDNLINSDHVHVLSMIRMMRVFNNLNLKEGYEGWEKV